MPKRGTQKISFKATKSVPIPTKVEFYTKKGEKISFKATAKVPKPVKVEFYAKSRKK